MRNVAPGGAVIVRHGRRAPGAVRRVRGMSKGVRGGGPSSDPGFGAWSRPRTRCPPRAGRRRRKRGQGHFTPTDPRPDVDAHRRFQEAHARVRRRSQDLHRSDSTEPGSPPRTNSAAGNDLGRNCIGRNRTFSSTRRRVRRCRRSDPDDPACVRPTAISPASTVSTGSTRSSGPAPGLRCRAAGSHPGSLPADARAGRCGVAVRAPAGPPALTVR